MQPHSPLPEQPVTAPDRVSRAWQPRLSEAQSRHRDAIVRQLDQLADTLSQTVTYRAHIDAMTMATARWDAWCRTLPPDDRRDLGTQFGAIKWFFWACQVQHTRLQRFFLDDGPMGEFRQRQGQRMMNTLLNVLPLSDPSARQQECPSVSSVWDVYASLHAQGFRWGDTNRFDEQAQAGVQHLVQAHEAARRLRHLDQGWENQSMSTSSHPMTSRF